MQLLNVNNIKSILSIDFINRKNIFIKLDCCVVHSIESEEE